MEGNTIVLDKSSGTKITMKILLFRSNNIFDSRVNKYHNYYERAGVDYIIVGWDRKGLGWQKERYVFYQYRSGEDVGGLRAIKNHIKWMFFVFNYLKRHSDVTTIHACDLNSAFPAAVFKALYKRGVTLIFDACDWFSAIFAKNKILRFCFGIMEKFTCRVADHLIICEPERIEQIQFKLLKKPLVMPNIPEIDQSAIIEIQDRFVFPNNNLTLAYLGGFSDNRFLLELLSLVETEPINLLIAGYGDSKVMERCHSVERRENVRYFGRVSMIEGLNMENAADIIYAMYCKTNPNNIYAAPNKYYEALLLGKPIITTKGTIVEKKVIQNDIGWAVEEDLRELRDLVNSLKIDNVKEKGRNALNLWNTKFKNYLKQFFDEEYAKIIN